MLNSLVSVQPPIQATDQAVDGVARGIFSMKVSSRVFFTRAAISLMHRPGNVLHSVPPGRRTRGFSKRRCS